MASILYAAPVAGWLWGPVGCSHTPVLDSIPLGMISGQINAQRVQGPIKHIYSLKMLSCIMNILFVVKASLLCIFAR